jgi:hypothetical protein
MNNDADSNREYTALNGRTNKELEGMWREETVTQFR